MDNLVLKETPTLAEVYDIDDSSGAVQDWYLFPQEVYFESQVELDTLTHWFLCISQTDVSLSVKNSQPCHLTEGGEAIVVT